MLGAVDSNHGHAKTKQFSLTVDLDGGKGIQNNAKIHRE